MTIHRLARLLLLLVILFNTAISQADEGMWLFNDLPKEHLKDQYGFEPSDEWVEHVMLSSVRFNSGGSASFVSSNGLVLTNHHVGAGTLAKLSTAEHNYHQDGFLAATIADEIPAPDLELNQLRSIEDVTGRILSAVTPEMNPAEASAARRAAMTKIEQESLEATGLRSDVVALYGGARFHLYCYKKYTDVRLVWAPEFEAAFFGGDADNFEYPRFCLDVCLFRVYENDEPASTEHFLSMSENGAADEELVFISGNPGRTERILTVAALKFQRDHSLPYVLDSLRRREILYQQFGFEGEEQERLSRDELFGVQNSRKALTGRLQGLQDPVLMAGKEQAEAELLAKINADPEHQEYAAAWTAIETLQQRKQEMLGQTSGFSSDLYNIANTLAFMAVESEKPNEERLRTFRDSARASLEQRLYSPAPISPELEIAELGDSLARFVEYRGGDDPLVVQVLDGKSPQARATELVLGTGLLDIATRRSLVEGGKAAIDEANDPMIELARMVEPESRRLRAIGEEVGELERQAYAQIADAIFAVNGTDGYPDATFTLRLSFGPVRGYVENGRQVPPMTTLGGAFEHETSHGAEDPWRLPPSWHERRDALELDTPCNFVCTADIIGGNSGSPAINREGELVGVIFDGNIQSLVGNYIYSDDVPRAVSVHSSFVLETLRKIYDADHLLEQLGK
jgi:hypothetical protein